MVLEVFSSPSDSVISGVCSLPEFNPETKKTGKSVGAATGNRCCGQICQGGCSELGQLLNPLLSPAEMAAMSEIPHARHSPESRVKSHMPGTPQSPDPPRKSAVTGQSPRNGTGMARSSSTGAGLGIWGRPQQHRNLTKQGLGAEIWLPSQPCCCPRSGQVTCPPTCYIFRASTPEPRLLLTKPRAPDTTLLQGQVSALATKACRSHRFSYFFSSRWEQKATLEGGKPYPDLLAAFILTR